MNQLIKASCSFAKTALTFGAISCFGSRCGDPAKKSNVKYCELLKKCNQLMEKQRNYLKMSQTMFQVCLQNPAFGKRVIPIIMVQKYLQELETLNANYYQDQQIKKVTERVARGYRYKSNVVESIIEPILGPVDLRRNNQVYELKKASIKSNSSINSHKKREN